MLKVQDKYDLMSPENIKMAVLEQYLVLKDGRTKEEYKRNLNRFFDWMDKQDHDSITATTIANYKLFLEGRRLKASSINTYLSPLKDFFKWCFEMDYMARDIGKHIRFVRGSRYGKPDQARALTPEEVKALMSATSKEGRKYTERLMILILFNLGLRISEVCKIRMQDIDFKAGTIDIVGKGDKLRILGLNDTLKAEIGEYLSQLPFELSYNDYLLQSLWGGRQEKPITTQHATRVLKATAKKADIDMTGVKSHSGRVTAINHLLDNDISIRDVANFAGHANINTTRRYDRAEQNRVIQTSNIINFTDKT